MTLHKTTTLSLALAILATFVLACPPVEMEPDDGISGDAVEDLDLSADGLWMRTSTYVDGSLNGVGHELVLTNVDGWCEQAYDVTLGEKTGELPFADLWDEAAALWDAGDPGGACEAWRSYYEAYGEFSAPVWYDGAAFLTITLTDEDLGIGAPPVEGSYPSCCDTDERPAFFGNLALHTGNYWAHLATGLDCEAAAASGDMWAEDFEELLPLESDVSAGSMNLVADGEDAWSFELDALELVEQSGPGAPEGTAEGTGTFTACDVEVHMEWHGG
jgi:hypothetical protein